MGFFSHSLEILTPLPPTCFWNRWALYSSHVKAGLNCKGCCEVTSSCGIWMVAFAGGDAKYTIDILASVSFTTALCSTLRNLPFVQAYTQHRKQNNPPNDKNVSLVSNFWKRKENIDKNEHQGIIFKSSLRCASCRHPDCTCEEEPKGQHPEGTASSCQGTRVPKIYFFLTAICQLYRAR